MSAERAAAAVEALTLTLGAFRLGPLDLALSAGEILVVLGPNGAGKSVTLETIAGFHRPEKGAVRIGSRDVTVLPPERRNVGFVVQNFGLFPHLTAADNVALARRRDLSAAHAAALPGGGEVAALLAFFGVAPLARRLPSDLSPGEKQRVALARALAGAPELFLFDEPFSALDSVTRLELRGELKSFLQAMNIPAIFVTHDHGDALTLADTIAVLREGRVVQRGPAAAVFAQPADSAIARFVGVDNILDGRVAAMSAGTAAIAVGPYRLQAAITKARAEGTAVRLAIRAEEVTIALSGSTAETNRLEGAVTGLQALGPLTAVTIDCGFALKAYLLTPQARGLRAGDAVAAAITPTAVHVMDA